MQNLNKDQVTHLVFVNEPGLNLHFHQEAGSSLKIHIINLPSLSSNCDVNNDIVVEQDGEGCNTEIYSLAYARASQRITTHTHIYHNVPGGRSVQLLKFVLDDKARGDFYGELRILPNAQKVDAQQTNRNLLLSPSAYMHTRPQLEIYADDVKASHGASTGQLDESALFYMQQRCIDAKQARQLLIGAFMKEVLLTIEDEEQRNCLMDSVDSVLQ